MSPVRYSSMLEGKVEAARFRLRLAMVRYAQERGIRAAARDFDTSRNTVRLWLRRYEASGVGALEERSRAPKRIPHKTSRAQERAVVRARRKAPCYGARRLKRMFELKPSVGAIARILRERKLVRRGRRKHERKKDLREVKS
jgi:transposase